MDSLDLAKALYEWFEKTGRPALVKIAPDRVGPLDEEFKRLMRYRDSAWRELPICFLGLAGVGKSSLLNALVSEQLSVLPQGGVGPLTAQATLVRYAAQPYLRIDYLPKANVNRLLFALERAHEAELRTAGKKVDAASDLSSDLSEDDRTEAEVAVASGGAEDARSDKIDAYKRQARLLIQGGQFNREVSTEYLLDGLRRALGHAPRWGTTLTKEDDERIARVRDILSRKGNPTAEHRLKSADRAAFHRIVQDHASGFLAPIIKRLEVGWDSELLKGGLVLVDLPGLGVANDEYRNVTNQHVRSARAVVLVVDRAGVGEATADLLRTTGFFNALLHDAYDKEAEPTHLIVAVVKLDLSATDAWRDERDLNPDGARKWGVHLEEASAKAIDMVRGQVHQELEAVIASGSEVTRGDRREAIDRVLSTLQVVPVSALEFRKWHAQDEEDRPRITHPDQSRVPEFANALAKISQEHDGRVRTRLDNALLEISTRVRSAFELLRAQWQVDTRAREEVEKLRAELETFLEPRRKEFAGRQGAFREFLRNSVPQQIESQVVVASNDARSDILKYLRKLEDCHWATLRAAVRRGGTFVGAKNIDVPNELTLRFEEPIAVVWSKNILQSLRQRTNELGKDYVAMVGEVVTWAREQGARVQPKLVEALHEDLKAETREIASVGKEAIAELKAKVKEELEGEIQKRVRSRCQKFVNDNKDVGPGVKARILALLREDLTDAVIEAARPAATKVLAGNYREVEAEITERFRKYRNPLETAAETLLASHEERLKRSDNARRGVVLSTVDEALSTFPTGGTIQGHQRGES